MINVRCPSCGDRLVLKERMAGHIMNCPECGEAIQVPQSSGENLFDFSEPSQSKTHCIRCGKPLHNRIRCRDCGRITCSDLCHEKHHCPAESRKNTSGSMTGSCATLLGCGVVAFLLFAVCGGIFDFGFRQANQKSESSQIEKPPLTGSDRIQQSRVDLEAIATLPHGPERQQRGQEWMNRYSDCRAVDGDFEQQVRFWQAMKEMEALGKILDQRDKQRAIQEWMTKYPDLVANMKSNIEAAAEAERHP